MVRQSGDDFGMANRVTGVTSENAEAAEDEEKTASILSNIHAALLRENLTTEIMVGLLTLLCIILTSGVIYLCLSRGIASLSRYVM